jgi:hypothetical protein
MQRISNARLVVALIAVVAAYLPTWSPITAQEQMTICHRTGSATAPWILLVIDARLWPEYEAQGAKRAASLADCADPTPAPAAPAAPPAPVAQQSTVAPAPTAPPPPTPAPTRVPVATPTPAPTVETAGVAVAQEASPEVSNLPKSGEPDRTLLVLGLTAMALLGAALGRFARGSS